jgi:stringent starvation protein B
MAFPMPSESAAETAGASDDATPADRPVGGGLRLATTEGNAEPTALAPVPATTPAPESDDDKPPEPPVGGGGPRPALKRIK